MGTPTPPPSPPGGPCANCDGVLWPEGQPPRFVKVTFEDLEKCPACPTAAPNLDFWYEQDPEHPCEWNYEDSLFSGHLDTGPAASTLWLTSPEVPADWIYFFDDTDLCSTNFTNEFLVCDPFIGSKGGTGHVHWPGP